MTCCIFLYYDLLLHNMIHTAEEYYELYTNA